MSPPTLHRIAVEAGDMLKGGRALIGPHGLTQGRHTVAWTEIAEIMAGEKSTRLRPIRGLFAAGALGAAATLVAGPLGIAGAAAFGAATGLKTDQPLLLIADDGRRATIRISEEMTAIVVAWHSAARAAVPTPLDMKRLR